MSPRVKITRAVLGVDSNDINWIERLNGNFLRICLINTSGWRKNSKGLLPYPTHEQRVGDDTCLVYEIPRCDLQKVFDDIHLWHSESRLVVGKSSVVPLTDGKRHRYSSAKVLHYKGYNYIVPPMFFKTGATTMGWGIPCRFY